jgi:hypothetical protein
MRIILKHGEALYDNVHPIRPVREHIISHLQHSLQGRIVLRDLLVVVILALYPSGSSVNENDRPIKFERLVVLCSKQGRQKDGEKKKVSHKRKSAF